MKTYLPVRLAPRTRWWRAASLAAMLSLCGCLMHHHPKQVGASMIDDKVTTERVEAALRTADSRAFQQVHVQTQNGTVTLSGTVPTPEAKARAAEVVASVHRDLKLQNDLQVWQSRVESREHCRGERGTRGPKAESRAQRSGEQGSRGPKVESLTFLALDSRPSTLD